MSGGMPCSANGKSTSEQALSEMWSYGNQATQIGEDFGVFAVWAPAELAGICKWFVQSPQFDFPSNYVDQVLVL